MKNSRNNFCIQLRGVKGFREKMPAQAAKRTAVRYAGNYESHRMALSREQHNCEIDGLLYSKPI